MTDEEKAEEYIRTDGTNGEKVWEKIHKEFPNCIVVKSTKLKERLSELFFEYTRVVYLDGLAEGRKENERLKEEIQNMRNSVKEVLLSEDCEVGQILKCVGLSWYEKEYVEGLKNEIEILKKQVNSQVGKYCDESGS